MPARGWCHGQEGRYYLAVRYVERVMVGYRQLGDHNGEGNCWARLGEFHHQLSDHAGGDRPAAGQRLVVSHVHLVVREVGDGLVHAGQVEVAGPGIGAGLRGDGGEGGGDRLRAAVENAEFLPVGPLRGRLRVAGVQRGGSLAEVAGHVDEVDQDRDFQPALPGVVADGGDLLPVAVDEEYALAGPVRVGAVGLVERGPDDRRNPSRNRGPATAAASRKPARQAIATSADQQRSPQVMPGTPRNIRTLPQSDDS